MLTETDIAWNDEAEQSVLGGIMVSPRYLPDVREKVRAADFYRPAHTKIFETIVEIADEGQDPDAITVANCLRDEEDVEALGGRNYILALPAVGLASRAPQHAAIVRQLAEERRQGVPVVGVRLSTVKPEQVSWLWPGWFPLGKVSTLDGNPGLGKSTVVLDVAARVSRGLLMPDDTGGGEPAGVVIVSQQKTGSRTPSSRGS